MWNAKENFIPQSITVGEKFQFMVVVVVGVVALCLGVVSIPTV